MVGSPELQSIYLPYIKLKVIDLGINGTFLQTVALVLKAFCSMKDSVQQNKNKELCEETSSMSPMKQGVMSTVIVVMHIIFGVACSSSAGLQAYSGYTGDYPSFKLVVDDRFDRFDETLWTKGDCGFTEPASRFVPDNVQVSNGTLKLIVNKEPVAKGVCSEGREIGEKEYSAAEIRSNSRYLYGRFEARIKVPHKDVASGYVASIFTYVNDIPEPYKWQEIDIEMEGGRPNKFQSNLIYGEGVWEWWRTREWGAFEAQHIIGPAYEWKVYAIEWVPDAIRWFVDGQLIREIKESDLANPETWTERQDKPAHIPDLAQQVMMNFWLPNELIAEHFGGTWERNVYPMVTTYDWFRYYEYTGD